MSPGSMSQARSAFARPLLVLLLAAVGPPSSNALVSITSFGAIPNDGNPDTEAIQSAIDYAIDQGDAVFVPSGVFNIDDELEVDASVTIYGDGPSSRLEVIGCPTLPTWPCRGAITIAGTSDRNATRILVRDLGIDGRQLMRGVYIEYGADITLHRLDVRDSSDALIAVYTAEDVTVSDCHLQGAHRKFGDGIYFGGVLRPTAVRNTISDITRIGIVAESNGRRSADVMFAGNTVSGAQEPATCEPLPPCSEFNAAIWLENTNGGTIVDNVGFDLTDRQLMTPPNILGSMGIVLAQGLDRESTFHVARNRVSDVGTGLVVATGRLGTVFVSGLTVGGGETTYGTGVSIQSARAVYLSHLSLGSKEYGGGSEGGVVVHLPDHDMDLLSIVDSAIGPTAGDSDAADLNIFGLQASLGELVVRGLHDWSVSFRHAPRSVRIDDSDLTYRTGNYSGPSATRTLRVTNTTIERTGTTPGPFFNGPGTNATYAYDNVTFSELPLSVFNQGAVHPRLTFSRCTFRKSALDVNGRATIDINDSRFIDHNGVGDSAIIGNFSDLPLALYVRDTSFESSATRPPIQNWNHAMTAVVLQGNVHTSQQLFDDTIIPLSHGGNVSLQPAGPATTASSH